MKNEKIKHISVDSYILSFNPEIQNILQELRGTIKKAAPMAKEKISYNMPAFEQNGILVYYAAYTNHIGFYPTGTGIEKFEKEIKNYKYSKGAIQFKLDEKLPKKLITEIVKFRIKYNSQKLLSQ